MEGKIYNGVKSGGFMVNVKIAGLGSCLPRTVVTNSDLERMTDTSEEWIVKRTGVIERRWATEEESLPILMTIAGLRACKDAEISPREIDYFMIGTNKSDPMLIPDLAPRVQYLMDARNVACFDVGAGCSGAHCGIEMAMRTIRDRWSSDGKYTNVMVIGGDTLSRVTYLGDTPKRIAADRQSAVMLADGAGAMILQPEFGSENGIKHIFNRADGSLGGYIHYSSGFRNQMVGTDPLEFREPRAPRSYFLMNGGKVHELVIDKFPEIIREAIEGAGLPLEILRESVIIPHQMNMRTIDKSVRRLVRETDYEPFYVYTDGIKYFGNTSTASMLIGLDETYRTGRIGGEPILTEGRPVIMAVFGAGMTYGASLTRWGRPGLGEVRLYDSTEQDDMVRELNAKYGEWRKLLAEPK